MEYIKVKKRRQENWYGIFVGPEFIGNIYFNGSTDIEMSELVSDKLESHGLVEGDLIDALQKAYSFENYYADPSILEDLVDDTDKSDYDNYEDPDLESVDEDIFYEEKAPVRRSIYDEAKSIKSAKDLYGESVVHYYKEETKGVVQSVNGKSRNGINLGLDSEAYRGRGDVASTLRKSIARLADEKIELMGKLRELVDTDRKLNVLVETEEMSSINNNIIRYRRNILSYRRRLTGTNGTSILGYFTRWMH